MEAAPIHHVYVSAAVWSLLKGLDDASGEAASSGPSGCPRPAFRLLAMPDAADDGGSRRSSSLTSGSGSGRPSCDGPAPNGEGPIPCGEGSDANGGGGSKGNGDGGGEMLSAEQVRVIDGILYGYLPEPVVEHLRASHQVRPCGRGH